MKTGERGEGSALQRPSRLTTDRKEEERERKADGGGCFWRLDAEQKQKSERSERLFFVW